MNTYFVAGHAKLPAGMAAQTIYETLTVTAELDKKHGVVIEVSCTLATEHGREFISRILEVIAWKTESRNLSNSSKSTTSVKQDPHWLPQ